MITKTASMLMAKNGIMIKELKHKKNSDAIRKDIEKQWGTDLEIRPKTRVFVSYDKGAPSDPKGAISVDSAFKDADKLIDYFYVFEGSRGKGHGKALLDHVLNDKEHFALYTGRESSDRAIKMYERRGFSMVKDYGPGRRKIWEKKPKMITKTANGICSEKTAAVEISEGKLKRLVESYLKQHVQFKGNKSAAVKKLLESLKTESLDFVIEKAEKLLGANDKTVQGMKFALNLSGYKPTPKPKPSPKPKPGPSPSKSATPFSLKRLPWKAIGLGALGLGGVGALGAGAYYGYNQYMEPKVPSADKKNGIEK